MSDAWWRLRAYELPTRLSSWVAVAGATGGALLAGIGEPAAVLIAMTGGALLAFALCRRWRTGVDLGSLIIFGALLYGGVGTTMVVTLVGTVLVVIAWDQAQTAIDLAAHFGTDPNARRLEATRLIVSGTVGVGSATLGSVIYLIARGGASNTTLAAMVIAVFFAMAVIAVGLRGGGEERRPLPPQ